LTKNCIIFLGTSASIPQKNRFTQGVAICGSKDCIVVDSGEGMQIRINEAGIDHRHVKLIAISHSHGDHVHGLLPFIESLKMKLESQKFYEKFVLTIVSPQDLCKYLNSSLDLFGIRYGDTLSISCIDSKQLFQKKEYVSTPSGDVNILPLPVRHGELENAYGFYIEVNLKKRNIGIFYSGDGVCRDLCLDELRKLKPVIIIHEATFLDYSKDSSRAYESGHATVYEASLLATEVNAYVLVLTHFSARYDKADFSDFISRARRVFSGEIHIAEDLAKIPLDILDLDQH